MAIKYYSLLCLSLAMSVNALAEQADSTNNYAYGAELTITNSDSMFSRVELNKQIYTQTISPTLDDIRVFNRNGQTVPFSLINIYDTQKNNQQFDLDIYAINHHDMVKNDNKNSDNYSVSIQGKNVNVSIDKQNNSRAKYSDTYLLQVPYNVALNNPINNLKLSFSEQPENWQATADIAYSSDLRYWYNVVDNAPVMALTNSDNQNLTLTDFSLQTNSYYKSKNWLITLYSQNPIPTLTNVIASANNTSINNALFAIDFSLVSSDGQTAIYSLPTQMPIKEFSIALANTRSILPVSIYYNASRNNNNWQKLEDRIIRRTTYDDPPTLISLNNRLVSQLKLVTINSSFENAPNIVAYRNKVDLVFNSANNGPFILAWGSAQPKAAALLPSELLSDNDNISSIPSAIIGNSVTLQGDKALNIDQPIEPKGVPQWVIWLGLIIGAGVLVLMACKLFKEIKKQ